MKAYLGMGSNLGDKEDNLQKGVEALNRLPGTSVTAVSDIYITKPVGYDNQDDFLNIAVEVSTELEAKALLGAALGIEAALGRVRGIKNGPRTVDIDLLLYGNEKYYSSFITVPHPRMLERGFVIKPMLDLPVDSALFDAEALKTAEDFDGVRFYKSRKFFENGNK